MSDDRISSTPITPRCPQCDGTFTTGPGVPCPACGSFSPSQQIPLPDMRLPATEDRWTGYDHRIYGVTGLFCLIVSVLFGFLAPGLLIPLGILLLPAVIRTIRLATRPAAHAARSPWAHLVGALVASFGVASLAGIAFAVASSVVCFAFAVVGDTWASLSVGVILGGIVGLVAFFLIFLKLWPRESEDDRRRRSPDPEN